MRDYGPLYKVITDQWFQDEPNRIVWFTRLLDAVDDNGVVAMSRAKFGRLFGCTPDAAFYFLTQLEKRKLVTRNSHANYTQNEENRRKESRKETSLSPTPPITKEKNKEKKTLTLSSAPDFVGDGFIASAKDLEKQKKAEERKARSEAKKQKEFTLVHKARGIFEAYYRELYDDSYYWSAKDAVSMKRLLKKITFGRTDRPNPLPCDDDSLLDALKVFLKLINKSWLMNNFSVTKIDGQYNEIVSEIKNKNNTTNGNRVRTNQEASTALLANQAANLLNDIAKADELYYRGKQGGE